LAWDEADGGCGRKLARARPAAFPEWPFLTTPAFVTAGAKAAALNDKELESVIECWDQKASDGESFRKYLI
jgi:hypothetical protein